ncbi:hypothetical protein DPMN_176446 [Dreissena polymorpha]|uniref:Rho termination factor N-terminal domain-containing protein n=1 Tax=Dreissena polymorpha TaxID=45954 RepID=A0A9D4EB04_DREPO|nr:hypothetical protein DPMN_176446 [Dreissena polymorpha]
MNTETVKELKKAAKYQGMRGYSKLTKAKLIAKLSARNDEDDDVWEDARDDARVDDVWEDARGDARADTTIINRLFNWAVRPVKTAVKNSYAWIIKHTPEPVKRAIGKKAEAFKAEVRSIYNKYYHKKPRSSERDIKISESAIVIRESKTALRRFVIDGVERTDAPTFLDIVRPEVVRFMSKHRQIK